ncbi:hypothetical protein WJX81_002138 [Elliptochloris bilobata]|uniref:MYB transcription factor n=1 Tax=Elliptochloris bilobata TaxID=381761 RepID=A0AAW1S883_9CHLO
MKPFAKPPLIRLDDVKQESDAAVAPREPGPGRKGRPWTAEEHLLFLQGLRVLGKGNWKGISRLFLANTRTPTQVASHAQKFDLRQRGESCSRRKSRFAALECQAAALFAPTSAVPPLFRAAVSSSDVAGSSSDDARASEGASASPTRPRPRRPRPCRVQSSGTQEDAAARLLQGIGLAAGQGQGLAPKGGWLVKAIPG